MRCEPLDCETGDAWRREQRRDLTDNVLYQTFGGQLFFSQYPIRNYGDWSLYIAAKAVAALVTTRPNGVELLREQHASTTPILARQTLIRLRERAEASRCESETWLAALFHGVPDLFEAAEALLIAYAKRVRAERARLSRTGRPYSDTPLPDDPEVGPILPRLRPSDALRIERAVEAVQAGEGNYKAIAARYHIGQKRLLKVLQERGINRPRGGYQRRR